MFICLCSEEIMKGLVIWSSYATPRARTNLPIMPALILRSVLERVSVGTEDKTVIRAINRGRLRSGTSEWEELIFWEQETVEPVVCYRDPDACPCFNRKAIPVWTHPVGACVSQPARIAMACFPPVTLWATFSDVPATSATRALPILQAHHLAKNFRIRVLRSKELKETR